MVQKRFENRRRLTRMFSANYRGFTSTILLSRRVLPNNLLFTNSPLTVSLFFSTGPSPSSEGRSGGDIASFARWCATMEAVQQTRSRLAKKDIISSYLGNLWGASSNVRTHSITSALLLMTGKFDRLRWMDPSALEKLERENVGGEGENGDENNVIGIKGRMISAVALDFMQKWDADRYANETVETVQRALHSRSADEWKDLTRSAFANIRKSSTNEGSLSINDIAGLMRDELPMITGTGSVERKKEALFRAFECMGTELELFYGCLLVAGEGRFSVAEPMVLSVLADLHTSQLVQSHQSCSENGVGSGRENGGENEESNEGGNGALRSLREVNAHISSLYACRPSLPWIISKVAENRDIRDVPAEIRPCALPMFIPEAATAVSSAEEVVSTFLRNGEKRFAAEYKYDGERCLVHWDRTGERVAFFSRNGKPIISRFRSLADTLRAPLISSDIHSFVLDAEVVVASLSQISDTDSCFSGERCSNSRKCTNSTVTSTKSATGINHDGTDGHRTLLKKSLLPFQVLSRIVDDSGTGEISAAPSVRTELRVFDLLHLDAESLISLPLVERKQRLQDLILRRLLRNNPIDHEALGSADVGAERAKGEQLNSDVSVQRGRGGFVAAGDECMGRVELAELQWFELDSDNIAAELMAMVSRSVSDDGQCEGLMLKAASCPYHPGARTKQWLKLKKDYIGSIADSIDVVPVAAKFGRGKYSGMLSSFLVAVRNEDSGVYEILCAVSTGISEGAMAEFNRRFESLNRPLTTAQSDAELPEDVVDISAAHRKKFDVFFDWWGTQVSPPVWEIRGADLTRSPQSTVGRTATSRGIALRFPRFVREREDRSDPSTTAMVCDLFDRQSLREGAEETEVDREEVQE